ncbi:hypothetical protein M514_04584 [Trichuris suis]|nr:hypothetical protein M514_04584 [Trichuris suis]
MEILVCLWALRVLLSVTHAYGGQNETIPPDTDGRLQSEDKWNTDAASGTFNPIGVSVAWLNVGLVDLLDTVLTMGANGIAALRNAYVSCIGVTLLLQLLLICIVLSYREWQAAQTALELKRTSRLNFAQFSAIAGCD